MVKKPQINAFPGQLNVTLEFKNLDSKRISIQTFIFVKTVEKGKDSQYWDHQTWNDTSCKAWEAGTR